MKIEVIWMSKIKKFFFLSIVTVFVICVLPGWYAFDWKAFLFTTIFQLNSVKTFGKNSNREGVVPNMVMEDLPRSQRISVWATRCLRCNWLCHVKLEVKPVHSFVFTRYNVGRIPRDKQYLYNKEYAGVSSKWDHRPLLNSKLDHLYQMNMSPTVYIMPDVHICRQLQFLYSPCLASSFIINVEVCLTTLMLQPTDVLFLSASEKSRCVW